ncbi:MAG TPA: PDZ domain-containing protein [Spirochaetia bacterium]|nr:PDZ domain-containing protein [Spirochaetia bacterium]
MEDIVRANADERYLDAIQLIDRFQREKRDLPADRLAALKEEAVGGVARLFLQAVEQEEYARALSLFASLEVLKETDRVSSWSAVKLYLADARRLEENGERVRAVFMYIRALEKGSPDAASFLHILALADELNNTAALQVVIRAMEKQGLAIPEPYRAHSLRVLPVADMIGGTVTIWVDKGYKIEQGAGMLDRVIGSGFFVDPRGYLLTNYHVIQTEVNPEYEGYSRLFVRLSQDPDRKIPARVVGFDPIFDLALVKVEVEPKFYFSSLRETEVRPGEKIQVIGSPIGLENTVTSGIISATGRRFLQMGDVLQLDAPVNPGNSGGPVLDDSGSLLGIVFAGVEQFEGINFALSAEWINLVLPELYREGQVTYPWLGMALAKTEKGLEIVYVVPGEPADNAGLATGDVIKSINDRTYEKIQDVQRLLLEQPETSLLSLVLIRGDVSFTALLNPSARPPVPVLTALKRDAPSNVIYPLFGMRIVRVTDSPLLADYMVERVLPGSIAEELGLSTNDPIEVRNWTVLEKQKVVFVEVKVKRRKLGFLETFVRLPAYLEPDNFV